MQSIVPGAGDIVALKTDKTDSLPCELDNLHGVHFAFLTLSFSRNISPYSHRTIFRDMPYHENLNFHYMDIPKYICPSEIIGLPVHFQFFCVNVNKIVMKIPVHTFFCALLLPS